MDFKVQFKIPAQATRWLLKSTLENNELLEKYFFLNKFFEWKTISIH